jgi:hypothetical protein
MNIDAALAHTEADRRKAERAGTKFLAANDNKPRKERVRYRGRRPAWNWLAKQDRKAAAKLWLFARRMLPDAANDNIEPDLQHLDRRKDGKLRGPAVPEFDVLSYLAIPPVRPRFGDAPPSKAELRGWHCDGFALKRQRQPGDYGIYPFGRYTRCQPGVAWCYGGLVDTVGKPRPGVSRGDVRRVDLPDLPDMPDRVFIIIENMLAGATLAGIGEALGYNGGYADRAGRKAMREAGQWALAAAA